jgi:hypothetical protein
MLVASPRPYLSVEERRDLFGFFLLSGELSTEAPCGRSQSPAKAFVFSLKIDLWVLAPTEFPTVRTAARKNPTKSPRSVRQQWPLQPDLLPTASSQEGAKASGAAIQQCDWQQSGCGFALPLCPASHVNYRFQEGKVGCGGRI